MLDLQSARSSAYRFEELLTAEEQADPFPRPIDDKIAVELRGATFAWSSDAEAEKDAKGFNLGPLDLSILQGDLVVVGGKIASGKSALARALLGEMQLLSGHAAVGASRLRRTADWAAGSIAYAAQLPCIWSCSLRDNILFGAELEEARYSRVLDACALRPDLAAMPAGDPTEIGSVDRFAELH